MNAIDEWLDYQEFIKLFHSMANNDQTTFDDTQPDLQYTQREQNTAQSWPNDKN